MASKSLSSAAFGLICAIGVAFLVLFLVIAGTRIDHGVPESEPMTAAEQARQDAAIELTKLASMSEAGSPELSAMASTYAEGLGGIWVPWPDGAPDGATNPPLDLSVPTNPSAEELGTQIDTTIALLEDALVQASDRDAPMYASMLLGLIAHHPSGPQFSAVPLDPEQFAEIVTDTQSVRRLDIARQWMETAASRQDGEERDRTLAYAARLDSMVSHMLQAGAKDERDHIAALPAWFLASPDPVELRSEAAASALDQMVLLSGKVASDRRASIVATAAQFLPVMTEIPTYPGMQPTAPSPQSPDPAEPTETPSPAEDPSGP